MCHSKIFGFLNINVLKSQASPRLLSLPVALLHPFLPIFWSHVSACWTSSSQALEVGTLQLWQCMMWLRLCSWEFTERWHSTQLSCGWHGNPALYNTGSKSDMSRSSIDVSNLNFDVRFKILQKCQQSDLGTDLGTLVLPMMNFKGPVAWSQALIRPTCQDVSQCFVSHACLFRIQWKHSLASPKTSFNPQKSPKAPEPQSHWIDRSGCDMPRMQHNAKMQSLIRVHLTPARLICWASGPTPQGSNSNNKQIMIPILNAAQEPDFRRNSGPQLQRWFFWVSVSTAAGAFFCVLGFWIFCLRCRAQKRIQRSWQPKHAIGSYPKIMKMLLVKITFLVKVPFKKWTRVNSS